MPELDHIVLANSAKIPCTIRTLRPYYLGGDAKPWVHFGQVTDALLYLASRAELPENEIRAMQELFENLSSSLSASADAKAQLPVDYETEKNT